MVPDTTPQDSYDSSLPEAQGQIEDSPKESASSHLLTKAALKRPRMVEALVVAAAIALGVGLGAWRHHKHSSNKSSTAIRCGIYKDGISSSLTFIGRQCRSIITTQLLHNISLMIHL